jgi:hypothetical protein
MQSARSRSRTLELHIDQLRKELQSSRAEEALLGNLLAVRRGKADQNELENAGAVATNPNLRVASVEARSSHPLVAATIGELERSGKPLHIGQIMAALQQSGVSIPGAGSQANLISYLRRDARIVRPTRGIYALTEWGFKSAGVGRRKRARKKRGRNMRGGAAQ